MKKCRIILFGFPLFLLIADIYAFVTFPEAILTADKTEIVIGEPINAYVEVFVPDFVNFLQTEENILIEGWDIQELIVRKDVTAKDKYTVKLKITAFSGRITKIPPIRFSYTNKDDGPDSEPKIFYFFSNSLPVTVKNIFEDDVFSGIKDIKQAKKMNIPQVYYYVVVLYGIFIIFFVYRYVIFFKIEKLIRLKYTFTCKEKTLRNLNKLYLKIKPDGKTKEYYFELSSVFNHFIAEVFNIEKEKTDTELLSLIENEKNGKNVFSRYYDEIFLLFEEYDKAKYTGQYRSDYENFLENFKKTKQIVERIRI